MQPARIPATPQPAAASGPGGKAHAGSLKGSRRRPGRRLPRVEPGRPCAGPRGLPSHPVRQPMADQPPIQHHVTTPTPALGGRRRRRGRPPGEHRRTRHRRRHRSGRGSRRQSRRLWRKRPGHQRRHQGQGRRPGGPRRRQHPYGWRCGRAGHGVRCRGERQHRHLNPRSARRHGRQRGGRQRPRRLCHAGAAARSRPKPRAKRLCDHYRHRARHGRDSPQRRRRHRHRRRSHGTGGHRRGRRRRGGSRYDAALCSSHHRTRRPIPAMKAG